MATEEKNSIQVPDPPQVHGAHAAVPESVKQQWRLNYIRAFKTAAANYPGNETEQRQYSEREANRLFSVDEPESYEQAMAIESWKILRREVREGQLHVTPIDGQNYFFPVPAKKPEKASAANAGGSKNGDKD